jgi:predicted aconitase with swiveling domain
MFYVFIDVHGQSSYGIDGRAWIVDRHCSLLGVVMAGALILRRSVGLQVGSSILTSRFLVQFLSRLMIG